MRASAARKADGLVTMLTAAQVAAFRARPNSEDDDASQIAFGGAEAIAGARHRRHRAKVLVAGDEGLGLDVGDLSHRAAIERRHDRPRIALGLALADALLMSGWQRPAPMSNAAPARAKATGGPAGIDGVTTNPTGRRDRRSGARPHGRSRCNANGFHTCRLADGWMAARILREGLDLGDLRGCRH